jgi:thioredoxin-related protein
MTGLARSIKTDSGLRHLQGVLFLLFFAGMIFLFVQKDKMLNRLSDAVTLRGSGSDSVQDYVGYHEKYDLERIGSPLKGTLLEFGARNCISCRKMEKVMRDIRNQYGQQVAIRHYMITEEEGMIAMREFGVLMIPMQVLVDRSGNVVYKHTGYISGDDLSLLIEDKLIDK